MILWMFACGTTLPFVPPCAGGPVAVDPGAQTDLGFSGNDALDWLGDTVEVDVTWRAGDTPRTDTLTLTLGALDGEVTYTETRPEPGVAPEECPNSMAFGVDADFATADGGVTGSGWLTFVLEALDFDQVAIDGRAEVALTDDRWLEVNRALDDSYPPPDDVAVYLTHGRTLESISIQAEKSQDYSVLVWDCAEGCADWR